jgi:hypothetical protein
VVTPPVPYRRVVGMPGPEPAERVAPGRQA